MHDGRVEVLPGQMVGPTGQINGMHVICSIANIDHSDHYQRPDKGLCGSGMFDSINFGTGQGERYLFASIPFVDGYSEVCIIFSCDSLAHKLTHNLCDQCEEEEY